MKPIKIYFSLTLLLIAGILIMGTSNRAVLGSVNAFDVINDLVEGKLQEFSFADAQAYPCTIKTPVNRTVVLRIDDIAPWNDLSLMQQMTDDILSRDYGVSLGVIPYRIDKDKSLVRWLQSTHDNSKVELSLHGYKHDEEEFNNLDYNQSKIKLELGRNIMIKYFGEIPINFIPPYNVESEETIQALKDLGFKTFSGSRNEYIVEDTFVAAGYTTTTYSYSNDLFVSSEQVLEECSNAIDKNGVCVIMVHPQDFTSNGKIDEAKYAEYVSVLDGLNSLDANVVSFREAFCEEY